MNAPITRYSILWYRRTFNFNCQKLAAMQWRMLQPK